MNDKPSQALRRGRKTSSMWLAIDAVKKGEADVAVSAGNTGALMAMSKFNLKTLAALERPAIAALEEARNTAPEKREAQRVLAREVTTAVHGADQTDRAEHASGLLFGEDITTLDVGDVLAVFEDVPSTALPQEALGDQGIGIVDLVARVELAASKSEARRLVQSGGVYVNNRRIADPLMRLTRDSAIGGTLFVLRKGQKQNHLVRLT